MEKITSLIIAFVVIGIVLGIGFLVLQEFSESIGDDLEAVTNETFTAVGTTGVTASHNKTSNSCFSGVTFGIVTNETSGEIIDPANYTTDAYSGVIYAVASSDYVDVDWNVSYTYLHDAGNSSACDGLYNTTSAMEEIPTWFAIIVIIFIAGIILAIVFKFTTEVGTGNGSAIAEI